MIQKQTRLSKHCQNATYNSQEEVTMDDYKEICCDECGKTIGYAPAGCNDGYAVLAICPNCHDKQEAAHG